MTKKEIVYNLLNILQSGRISDDHSISYRQLSFIVDYKRSLFLRRDATANWFDMDTVYQDLGILQMEEVDSAECCCFESGCTIYRTVLEIPDVLRYKLKYALKINAIDKRKRFELVLPERFDFIGYTKFGRLTEAVYFLNKRLYTQDLAALNVRAVLSKPNDAKGFQCGDEACFNDDMDYPLPSDMITLITNDILGTELKTLLSLGQDLENDATNKDERVA